MIRHGVEPGRRHLAEWHDKQIAGRRDHALADRSSVDQARRQAPFIAQLYAEMQTQRILNVEIDDQNAQASAGKHTCNVNTERCFADSTFGRAKADKRH